MWGWGVRDQTRPAGIAGLVLVLLLLAGSPAAALSIAEGDILVSNSRIFEDFADHNVLQVDPFDGGVLQIAEEDEENRVGTPVDAVSDAYGQIYLANVSGHIVAIDPVTGADRRVSESNAGDVRWGTSIVLEGDQSLLLARLGYVDQPALAEGIVERIDLSTGARIALIEGVSPMGIALDAQGRALLTDRDPITYESTLVRVDLETGAREVLGLPFQEFAVGVAVGAAGQIYVVEREHVGDARVLEVDPITGARTVLVPGGVLVRPSDLAIEADGSLVVVDTGGQGGSVIRIDPTTGQTTEVSRGAFYAGTLWSFAGISVVPVLVPEPSTGALLACGVIALSAAHRRAGATRSGGG